MPEFEQKASTDELLYNQLLFTSQQAEEVLILLGNFGVPLPNRFYQPAGLTKPDHHDRVPASEFPLRKRWADAINETQDALNSAASDASQYPAFVKKRTLRQRELTVLQSAASKILLRLTKLSSSDSGGFALYQEISETFDPFSDGSDLDEFLTMLGHFSTVVLKMQQDADVKTKEQLALLFSSDLRNPQQEEDTLTQQSYLIRRYTRVFENLFELVPSEYTSKTYNAFSGVYPDFIREIFKVHTGKSLTDSALTKALQRAAVPKLKT